jgi:xanthine/CO dehydrogenase XdhC/CoxF family maturation factor
MSAFIQSLRDQTKTRFGRMRLGLATTYLVALIASAMPLVSLGTTGNLLGAAVVLTQGGEGSVYINLRNEGPRAWTHAELDVDGRFVLSLGNVAAGSRLDLQVSELTNREQIPRPPGLFSWERGASQPFPGSLANMRYVPTRITVSCDEGEVAQPVSL